MSEEKQGSIVRNQAERVTREERVPLGLPQLQLQVPFVIEGYHLHWVNDDGARLVQAQAGGYEFVSPAEVGWAGRDETISKPVGKKENGDALVAYLMKIRQEWYDEDQARLQGTVNEFERAIKKGSFKENPLGSAAYMPGSGIQITKE